VTIKKSNWFPSVRATLVAFSVAGAAVASATIPSDARSDITPPATHLVKVQSTTPVPGPVATTEPVLHAAFVRRATPTPQSAPKPKVKSSAPFRVAGPGPKHMVGQKPKAKVAIYRTISSYAQCGLSFQKCINRGSLTLYYPNGYPTLAGHNYMGWSWLDDVPTGKVVRVTYGPAKGTYKVYSHMRLNHQGGKAPSFGSAALVLQTCAGSGTGFSLLHRI
jgi:hypothetical protein